MKEIILASIKAITEVSTTLLQNKFAMVVFGICFLMGLVAITQLETEDVRQVISTVGTEAERATSLLPDLAITE